ncbi:hypothetical protein [Endozoicomonas sp. 2B-B]
MCGVGSKLPGAPLAAVPHRQALCPYTKKTNYNLTGEKNIMAKKESLLKLIEIIESHKANRTDMMFRNFFSSACHLSLQGKDEASRKVLRSLFDWLGYENRKTYFNNIIHTLPQYAEDYAWEISANCEFNELVQKITRSKEPA